MQGVYWIINWLNLKRYIGSAKDIQARWGDHVKMLREDGHGNQYIQNAWNKYVPVCGEEVFVLEVVEEVGSSRERAFVREQHYLDLWWDTGFLYNLSQRAYAPYGEEINRRNSEAILEWYETHDHPMLGKRHTEESRRKNSESNKEWHRMHEHPCGFLGKHHTEESKQKNREAVKKWYKIYAHPMKGKHLSQEHKDKVSLALLGDGNPMYGKHHTEETKAKISEAKRGKALSKAHRAKIGKANKGNENSVKSYPAFFNVVTEAFISAGRNLSKLCRDKGLNRGIFVGLKSGATIGTRDGWRLAAPKEIEEHGTS